tara:strand:+ start:32789 stop:33157 length:369 start_codon:yes stop_codon:yes gene_type:complete
METTHKKMEILNDIGLLHRNFMGMLRSKANFPGTQKVSFAVRDHSELLLNIASLLEVCVFALDGDGMLLSPTQTNVSKEDSVSRVLELVLNILPDAQMQFVDQLDKKMTEMDLTEAKPTQND